MIESLEARRMLAAFSYVDNELLINLDAASTLSTLGSANAAGSGGYTFSLSNGDTFSGSDTVGLAGSGKNTLSVTSSLVLSRITITNSVASTAVSLGAGRYVDDLTVSLNSYSNPPVPSFRVAGSASFAGCDLSVTAPSIVVAASITDAGNIILSSSTTVDIQGTSSVAAAGDLTIMATSAVTQAKGSVLSIGGIATVTTGSAAIGLDGTGNDFKGTVNLFNTGVNAVSLTDKSDLTLGTLTIGGTLTASSTGSFVLGTGSVGGNLIVNGGTSTTGGAITQSAGGIAVAGTSRFTTGRNGIVLSDANNDFIGAVSLSYSGTAWPSTITDKNALKLGTTTIGGSLRIESGGLSQTGVLSVGGTTSLLASAASTDIDLSTQANLLTGAVEILRPENVRDFKLTNGRAGAGAVVNLSDAETTNLRDVSVRYDNAAYQIPSLTTGSLRNITFVSKGALTQAAGGIRNSGTATFTANSPIALNDPSNDFGGAITLETTGANAISIRDQNALTLGSVSMDSSAAGTLHITSNGAITQTSTTAIRSGKGAVTFAAGAAAITLNNVGNDFRGAVSLSNTGANAITIRDVGALALGGVSMTPTAAGVLAVTTSGAITQTGAIVTGSGQSSLNAGAGAIALNNAGNDFGGAVSLTNSGVNAISIRDMNALTLSAVNMSPDVTGNLSLTSNGAITQTGGITIGAGTITVNAGAGAILLDNAANDFRGAVSLFNTGANNIAIHDTGALVLSRVSMSSAGGALTVTSYGALTQIGAIVTGTGATTVSSGPGAITLTNTGNDFRGVVNLTNTGANSVSVTDKNNLTLSTLTIGGTLRARSTESFVLGTGSEGGNLVVTAGTSTTGGAITQSAGGIAVAGTSSFTTGRIGIVLSDANNDFVGAVSLSYLGSVDSAITDKNALILGTSTIAANLRIESGRLSQTGVLSVGGTTTLLASAPSTDIDLTWQANLLTGTVSILSPENVRDFGLRNDSPSAARVAQIDDAHMPNLRDLTINYPMTTIDYSVGTLTMASLRDVYITVAVQAIVNGDIATTGKGSILIKGGFEVTPSFPNGLSGGVNVYSQAKLSTTDGSIHLIGYGGTDNTGGNIGVFVAGTIQAAGAGLVYVHGTGGRGGYPQSNRPGSDIQDPDIGISCVGVIESLGSGSVTLIGVGGTNLMNGDPQNTDGNACFGISIQGIPALDDSGDSDPQYAVVRSGGAGDVVLDGTGGYSTGGFNHGVLALCAQVQSGGGNVSVTGHGGSGEGGQNYGVWFSQSTIQAGGDGGVTIEGHGGNKDTGSENHGVVLGLSNIASNGAGAVLVEGWGGTKWATSNANNIGVYSDTSVITSYGSGSVTVRGWGGRGGAGSNYGIYNALSTFASTTGDVVVEGTGGDGGSFPENWKQIGAYIGIAASTVVLTFATLGIGDAIDSFLVANREYRAETDLFKAAKEAEERTAELDAIRNESMGLSEPEATHKLRVAAEEATYRKMVQDAGYTYDPSGYNFEFQRALELYKENGTTSRILSLAATANKATARAALTGFAGLAGLGAGITLGTTKPKDNINGDGKNLGIWCSEGSLIASGGNGNCTVTGIGGKAPTGHTAKGDTGGNHGIVSLGDFSASGTGTLTINGSGNGGRKPNGHGGFVDSAGDAVLFSGFLMSSGDLNIVSTKGSIIQYKEDDTRCDVVVVGKTTISAAAGSIVLYSEGNDFDGGLNLINTGGDNSILIRDANALVLTGVSMANDGGALAVTTHGEVTQTGAIVTGAGPTTINSDDGAITLDNTGNNFRGAVSLTNTGANTIAIRDAGSLVLSRVSMTPAATGGLAVTTNGALTQTGAIVTGTAATTINSGNGVITLNNTGNSFAGATSLTNTGANAIGIRTVGLLTLSGVSMTPTASGALTTTSVGVQQVGGTVVTGTGAVTINAGAGNIGLGNAGNDFRGAVRLTNTGASHIAIGDSNSLVLSGVSMSNAGGTLAVNANGAITQTGDILTGTGLVSIDAGAGAVTLTRANNNFRGVVSLVNTGANSVSLTDKNTLTLGSLTIGGTLTARSTGSFVLGTGSVGANLSINAGNSTTGGAITQSAGGIAVAGTSSFTTGRSGILLTDTNNDFIGAVSLSYSGSVASGITDKNALVLGTSTIGGALSIGSGGLSQTGMLSVGGTTQLAASTASSDIDLSTQANRLTGAVEILYAENVRDFKLRNTSTTAVAAVGFLASAVNLRDLTIDYSNNTAGYSIPSLSMRNATITVNGPITQTVGGIRVSGTSSFTTGRNGIVLSAANNDFGGAVSLSYVGTSWPSSITDINALTLGSVVIGQDLTVRANGSLNLGSGSVGRNLVATSFNNNAVSTGAITQSGKLTVGGTSVITAGAAAITLTDSANNFAGLVSLTNSGANNVAITHATALAFASLAIGQDLTALSNGALNLGTGSVGRNLIAKSFNNNAGPTGAITQSGKLAVGGTAALTAGAAAITLTNAANNFTAAVSLTNSGANNVAITAVAALVLGESSIGRNLAVTTGAGGVSGTGNLTQTGILTVTGATTLTAAAANTTINLATQPNVFYGGIVAGPTKNIISYQV